MSVIPFILGKTICTDQSEYAPTKNLVLIQDMETKQLDEEPGGKHSSNISYDLRVGDVYYSHLTRERVDITETKNEIEIKPSSSVIIQTEESVSFPACRFGQILPKVKLLQEGLSNTTSKIDPGYNGHLVVSVFNLSKSSVFLKKGDPFCALILNDIKLDGVKSYNKPQKSVGEAKISFRTKVRIWLEMKIVWITFIYILIGVVFIVLRILELVLKK